MTSLETEIFSVPWSGICKVALPLIVYVAGLLVILCTAAEHTKMKSIVLMVANMILMILPSYFLQISMILVGRFGGAEAMVSLSAVESAVQSTITPFVTVSFGLFSMACGCYLGAKES